MIAMPMAIQNRIKPSILFILFSISVLRCGQCSLFLADKPCRMGLQSGTFYMLAEIRVSGAAQNLR